MTTTKRADELQVGDVFQYGPVDGLLMFTATEMPKPSSMLPGYVLVHSTLTLPNAFFAGRGDKNEFHSEMQLHTAVLSCRQRVEVLTP